MTYSVSPTGMLNRATQSFLTSVSLLLLLRRLIDFYLYIQLLRCIAASVSY